MQLFTFVVWTTNAVVPNVITKSCDIVSVTCVTAVGSAVLLGLEVYCDYTQVLLLLVYYF